ncbi:hypothetical protein BJV78DRAFT_1209431, partial [Lactifluus subvellereus]
LQHEDRQEGTVASTDMSVTDNLASIASLRRVPSDLEDVEAARWRVRAQRLEATKRIGLEQLQKQARLGAWQLRQRADDLERETAENIARLLQEMEEDTASTAMEEDEDRFDVWSNHSYTPTETSESSSSGDDEYWSSPPHTPRSQTRHIEERSPTPILPTTPLPSAGPSQLGPVTGAETASFVVVTRQVVDGLNDLTGLPVCRAKRYRVRAADLESLCGDFDMEEL